MRVLVIGGSGRVGRRAAATLRNLGAEVRLLSRRATPGRSPAGVEPIVADLEDVPALRPALRDVDRVLIATPPFPREVDAARACIDAAAKAGVERIAYVSAAGAATPRGVALFERRAAVEATGRGSGIDFTVIRPVCYFQNDLLCQREIVEEGVYPIPIGDVGVSRVDADDTADAAAAALLAAGSGDVIHELAGPDELTGDAIAEVYSRNLGRPVRYGGDGPEAWSAGPARALPDWIARELLEVYSSFQLHGAMARDADLAAARRLIGRPLRTFEEYVAESTARWRS